MFLINCPYCGERDQVEFSCGGFFGRTICASPPQLNSTWSLSPQ
jgi:sarcosine oxidase delta subunit